MSVGDCPVKLTVPLSALLTAPGRRDNTVAPYAAPNRPNVVCIGGTLSLSRQVR